MSTGAEQTVFIDGHTVYLAEPAIIPDTYFVGRERELELCKAAWGISPENPIPDQKTLPMHFRICGDPGVGKTEIVFQLARELKRELYIVQGHEDLSPEELSLFLVPHGEDGTQFRLQASQLATAIYKGACVVVEDINRIPEKTLSCLVSVLDDQPRIYSQLTGIYVRPPSLQTAKSFRFCCTENLSYKNSGRNLPDYIAQRTTPVIEVKTLSVKHQMEIWENKRKLRLRLPSDFQRNYLQRSKNSLALYNIAKIIHHAVENQESYMDSDERLLKLLSYKEKLGERHQEFQEFLDHLIAYFYLKEDFERTTELAYRKVSIWEKLLGQQDFRVACHRHDLAKVLWDAGKYNEAQRQLEQVIEIFREDKESTKLHLANVLNLLAMVHRAQANYETALQLYTEVLDIQKAILPDGHPTITTTIGNIGVLFRYWGRYSEALSLMKEALEKFQHVYGEGGIQFVININNIGRICWLIGKFEEAEKYLLRALEIREESVGSDHSDTAYTQNSIARLYIDMEKLEEAKTMCEKALKTRENRLGTEHPLTASSYFTKALLCHHQMKYEQAHAFYQKALDIRRKALGERHPDTSMSKIGLASLPNTWVPREEAKQLLNEAIEHLSQVLDKDKPQVAKAKSVLARLYSESGDYMKACDCYQQAFDIFCHHLQPEHPDYIACKKGLDECR